jgi:OmpA-OmpF porin, OOP family
MGTPVVALAPPATTPLRVDLGAFIDKRLPNGTTLRIPTNGVESRLIAFIEDPTRRADKETWFSFDRLEFETDSATLRPSSQEQLRNIAEIMKAYPNVNAKIGGYTDNVGEDAYNMKLSTNRARNTEQEIVKLGVNDARLDAEGYGEQHPVADNATEEGRQRNRRIDIRVTKK